MSNLAQKKSISNISSYYFKSLKNLHNKYISFENSYELICINNLIYTENCRIVARFKDFLYYDDSSEFLKKYYIKEELPQILTKTFDFYAKYCKVFPNYMILPENEFLYKNLRKKQKMIDKLNEIKKEEEENRKHLKLKKNKENENDYILFNKKVQESIEKYKPSFNQSTILMDYINFNNKDNNDNNRNSKILNDSDYKNSKIISLNFNNTNYNVNNSELNDLNVSDLTVISLLNGINATPNKNKDKNKISFTPKKKKMLNTEDIRITNNGNKKFISHYPNMKKSINKQNNNNKNNNNLNSNIKKKEIKKNITNINNNNTSTTIKKTKNNISQSKTSNQLFISSLQKKNKDIQSKTKYITKRKLFFTDTEKMISNKKSIYNYNNKKLEKNSHSINTNKYKKKLNEVNYQSVNPSISPPNNKINTIKLKLIDDMIIKKNKKVKSNIVMYNKNKNIIKNNLSYNNNINSFQNTEQNISCKINADLTKKEEKTINNQNTNNCPKTSVKEIINKYKNILKNRKSNHFSHDINKNNLFLNKKIYSNLTENNSNNIQNNKANKKNRKTEVRNNYISPINKKNILIFSSGIKTPLNQNAKYNNKFHTKISKTKQTSQPKIQNCIKKTLDKNK